VPLFCEAIATGGLCLHGKGADGSQPPKSSSSLGTPTVSIAAILVRCICG